MYEITDEERHRRSERVKGDKNPMHGVPSPMKGKTFSDDHRKYPKANASAICGVCKGRCKTSGGYRWAYASEIN